MEEQFYDKMHRIDDAINKEFLTEEIVNDTFALIKNDIELNIYFFHNVRNLQWFNYLSKEGYFLPERIQEEADGSWAIFEYLKHISEQKIDNVLYYKELIRFINNIVQYSLNEKQIKNYNVWWNCLKIVINIPTNILTKYFDILEFREWLSVFTDSSIAISSSMSDIGEQLLPKFLSDEASVDDRFEYAEAIVDAVTEIQLSAKPSGIIRRHDIGLILDSYWVRQTFSKYAQLIGQKCRIGVIFNLADKLKRTLEYKQNKSYVNLEINKDIYQIEVQRIPVEDQTTKKIEFVDGQYKCIVKKFSADQIENVDKETMYLALHDTEPQFFLKSFDFTAKKIDIFSRLIKKDLPTDINWSGIVDFEKRMGYIFDSLYNDYTYVWSKTLTVIPDYQDDAQGLLTTILRDVLLAKCDATPEEGKKVLAAFLSDKYLFPIFKRFVLVCIDKQWGDFRDFLERFFEAAPNALHKPDFSVELYDILHNHNPDFSSALRNNIKALITEVPAYYIKLGEKQTAYWKYEWLSPLRNNPDFSSLYEEEKLKADVKIDKPYEPRRSAIEGGLVTPRSPISTDDILKKPVTELVQYLKDFKGSDEWGTFDGKPNKRGLTQTLQAAVKQNPRKFTDELFEFCGLDHTYIQSILYGLTEVWRAGKELDWEMIFSFALKFFQRDKDVILKETLQYEGEDGGKGKYIWIIDEITNLIAEGCKNDERVFDPKYFGDVETIFGLVLPLLISGGYPDKQGNTLNYALNTTFGRTIIAYVSFSLRIARTGKIEKDWGITKYERFFKTGIEAIIWFGCYLPQIKYLDEKYVKEKIEFFDKKNLDDSEWQMFMEGYLEGAQVYPDLYVIMRHSYLRMLERSDIDKSIEERLIQHICIGYLYHGESLTNKNKNGQDSLFWKMLAESGIIGKHNRWLETAKFLWQIIEREIRMQKKDEEEESRKIRDKILEFWSWTYDQQDFAKSILADDYGTFLGRMAELTILLDHVDEEKEKWLLLCAPYAGRDAVFFIEYLNKFDDEESIKRIGKIFLKLLEEATPTFRQEQIESIVRKIYEKGERGDADVICNTYGRKGFHFLKPLWEVYRGR